MLNSEEAASVSHDMRVLLSTLLLSEDPISIETAAVRSGLGLNIARNASLLLLTAGFARRTRGEKGIMWSVSPTPEVLSAVASHVCDAFATVSKKTTNIFLPKRVA